MMQYISGIARNQMVFMSLEDSVSKDNPVRFVDAFVENIDLKALGFELQTLKTEGRPGFNSKIFLKIYLYGYLNGLRSSRKLEKETIRNTEMQWLLCGITPNYHSISDFRKDNPAALKKLFKVFVSFLKDADLIAGETIAIDGTKSRAHNSKKANFNQKKIDRHLAYIEEKTQEYLDELSKNDENENILNINKIQEKIERLKRNKINYQILEERLKESGEPQISTTDEDSRALLVQGAVVEVSYNIQAAVDEKYKLVVATHTINRNDRNALSAIAIEAKENLNIETYTALVDKGYHNGRELTKCREADIRTVVAYPTLVKSNENGTTAEYLVANFIYDKEADTYQCPQNQVLKTTGKWHKKSRDKDSYNFKKYRTTACKECAAKSLCTSRSGGREIDRSEFAEAVEENNRRYRENGQLYRKRQEINEHIFGTIKRQWGYNHTNLTGLEKVNGEHSLIMLVYNIKRAVNILGVAELIARLKSWKSPYKVKVCVMFKVTYFKLICDSLKNHLQFAA